MRLMNHPTFYYQSTTVLEHEENVACFEQLVGSLLQVWSTSDEQSVVCFALSALFAAAESSIGKRLISQLVLQV